LEGRPPALVRHSQLGLFVHGTDLSLVFESHTESCCSSASGGIPRFTPGTSDSC